MSSPFSSVSPDLTWSLLFPSYLILCGCSIYKQPWLYKSLSASLQLVVDENCSTCRCIFDFVFLSSVSPYSTIFISTPTYFFNSNFLFYFWIEKGPSRLRSFIYELQKFSPLVFPCVIMFSLFSLGCRSQTEGTGCFIFIIFYFYFLHLSGNLRRR